MTPPAIPAQQYDPAEPNPALARPTKAIPPARDRLQSRILVWIVAPLIVLACVQLIHWMILSTPAWTSYLVKSLALSVAFALAAWALRAATPTAALIGGMICLLLTCFTGSMIQSPLRSAVAPLLTLFFLTFIATRAGRRQKLERGLAESRKGRRASQVIANLGLAALVSNMVGDRVICWLFQGDKSSGLYAGDIWILPVIITAVLAEATADTVSSEIGQAFGGRPILLTTFCRVDTGTDGAFSLTGTAAGILAAAFVVAAGGWSMHLQIDQVGIALAAATLGLFFDSLLGATLERRGWLGNDLVNFASTTFAAGIVFPLTRLGPFWH